MHTLIPYAAIGLLTVLIVLREDAKEDAVDCFGDWPAVPQEMRPAQRVGGGKSVQSGRADTRTQTHSRTSCRTQDGSL